MAKTATRVAYLIKKIEKLIGKGLIIESDIIDSTVKAEYLKVKK